MNTNYGMKWRRFIVPENVEQINDHLFIDTFITLVTWVSSFTQRFWCLTTAWFHRLILEVTPSKSVLCCAVNWMILDLVGFNWSPFVWRRARTLAMPFSSWLNFIRSSICDYFEFILFLLCSFICNYGVTLAVLFVYPVTTKDTCICIFSLF